MMTSHRWPDQMSNADIADNAIPTTIVHAHSRLVIACPYSTINTQSPMRCAAVACQMMVRSAGGQ